MNVPVNKPAAVRGVRALPDLRTLEEFIHWEVRLLDERRFEEWMELFSEDGAYWAPTVFGQDNPNRLPSLFYDNRSAMKARITRLRHPRVYVQDPPSRTRHMVTGFYVTERDEVKGECAVNSSFIMLEYRPGYEQRVFGGQFLHRVRVSDDGLRIVLKRAELINCDASFRAMAIPF